MSRGISLSITVVLMAFLTGCDGPHWNGSATGPTPAEETELISIWERGVAEKRALRSDEAARLEKLTYKLLPDLRAAGLGEFRWVINHKSEKHNGAVGLFVALRRSAEVDAPSGTVIPAVRAKFSFGYPNQSEFPHSKWKPGNPIEYGTSYVVGNVLVHSGDGWTTDITIETVRSLFSKVRFDILARIGVDDNQ